MISRLLLLGALLIAPFSYAAPTLVAEGIANDVDLKQRDPIMTFGKAVFADSSRILVDAVVRNDLYANYPLRFDFYINGNLTLSQFRSKELPIPVGITLNKKDYPLPYNFTLVATLVTPNRTFTTTAYGAMKESDFAVTLPCTVTLGEGDAATTYTADSVAFSTDANGSISLSFNATAEDQSSKTVTASFSVTGSTASGTVSTASDGEETAVVNVDGSVTVTDGNLSALSVESGDATTTLSCG